MRRVNTEIVEQIANFPPLPVDGSPSAHSIRLDDVRSIAREVLESRALLSRMVCQNCGSGDYIAIPDKEN